MSLCPLKIFYHDFRANHISSTIHVDIKVMLLFLFVIECSLELGEWCSCNRLQRCKSQCVQTDLPGENVSEHHVIWQVSMYCCWVNTMPFNFPMCNMVFDNKPLCLIADMCVFLFTPTRTARSRWRSRLQCKALFGVGWHTVVILFSRFLPCFTLCFSSIYKMFPADKKRVENALASAHLPKGKVRKHRYFSGLVLVSIPSIQSVMILEVSREEKTGKWWQMFGF